MIAALRHGNFPEDGARGEKELMESFAARLGAVGVEVNTEGGIGGCDLLHVFGTSDETHAACREAQSANIPIISTPLYWNDEYPIHYAHAAPHGRPELREREPDAAFYRDKMMLAKPRKRGAMLEAAADVFATGACEKMLLVRDFGLPAPKVAVMPLGVDLAMCAGAPGPFREMSGISGPFILCAGEISRRGNQHVLIEATRDMDIDVVFAGNAEGADVEYINYCNDISHERAHFTGELDTQMMKSACHAASALVQPALCELPGLHCLSAAMSGCPIAVTERGTARDYFGGHAFYFDPENPDALSAALSAALAAGRGKELKNTLIKNFSWGKTMLLVANIYKKLAQNGAAQNRA